MKLSNFLYVLFVCLVAATTVNCQETATEDAKEIDPPGDANATATDEVVETTQEETEETTAASKEANDTVTEEAPPVQTGPFIDLFGPTLLSLEMISDTQAQLQQHYTNDALSGKNVIGLYFSADWCGPCRQFTPDLVTFYNKINARRGKKDKFEIVWISRCRDFDSFGQYFTHMNWLALPPQEAMGERGQWLSQKFKVKGIPHLVLLDEVGNVITYDARNKIPQDKAGIGFPWRNPIARIYMTLFPKSLRLMIKSQVSSLKDGIVGKLTGSKKSATATA